MDGNLSDDLLISKAILILVEIHVLRGRGERCIIAKKSEGAALTLFTLLVELRQMQMLATVPFMNAAADVREGNRFNI